MALAPTVGLWHMGREEGLLRRPEDSTPGACVPRPECGTPQRALLQDHQLDLPVIMTVAVYRRQRIVKRETKPLDAAKAIEYGARVTLNGEGPGQILRQDTLFGVRQ